MTVVCTEQARVLVRVGSMQKIASGSPCLVYGDPLSMVGREQIKGSLG